MPAATAAPHEILTPRQREVMRLIGLGYSSAEIAQKLQIAVKTVEVHKHLVYQAIGVRRNVRLSLYCVHHGIISPQEIPLAIDGHADAPPQQNDEEDTLA